MAYSTANRPYLTVAAVAGGQVIGSSGIFDYGGNQWAYRSTDTLAAVATTGYFTDGGPGKLNMRVGDLVGFTRLTTAGVPTAHHFLVISSASTNGASPTILNSSSS